MDQAKKVFRAYVSGNGDSHAVYLHADTLEEATKRVRDEYPGKVVSGISEDDAILLV